MKRLIEHEDAKLNAFIKILQEDEDGQSEDSAYKAAAARSFHLNNALETLHEISGEENGFAGITASTLALLEPVAWYSIVHEGVRFYLRDEIEDGNIGYVLMSAINQYVEENPLSREDVFSAKLKESDISSLVYSTYFNLIVGVRGLDGVLRSLMEPLEEPVS